MVTSTLLAGLGFSGGVISSFPSSVWPTRAPPPAPAPTRQVAKTVTPVAESGATQASDTDSTAKDHEGGGSEGEKDGKGEEEEGQREGEEDEDDEAEKETVRDRNTVPTEAKEGGSVAKEPPSAAPDSTAKEKGQRNASAAPPTGPSLNDTSAIQPSDVTTLSYSGPEKNNWPFVFHTGEGGEMGCGLFILGLEGASCSKPLVATSHVKLKMDAPSS